MKLITLTQGKVAIVDDDDYEYLNRFKWHISGKPTRRYAQAKINGKLVLMHQIILPPIQDCTGIDHRDCNSLNNQKYNLRYASDSQNVGNSRVQTVPKSSKYKGVYFDKSRTNWQAYIKFHYKYIHLGRFNSEDDAAEAYNEAAIKYFGEFARINDTKLDLPKRCPRCRLARKLGIKPAKDGE